MRIACTQSNGIGVGGFWRKNFGATRGFRDIETIPCIKYVCLLPLLLCFHVSHHNDICADEFCHNIPMINFISSSHSDIILSRQVLLPMFHICTY